jgi:hypothetical protein
VSLRMSAMGQKRILMHGGREVRSGSEAVIAFCALHVSSGPFAEVVEKFG